MHSQLHHHNLLQLQFECPWLPESHFRKNQYYSQIIPKLFPILKTTYYSQNYSGIGLALRWEI